MLYRLGYQTAVSRNFLPRSVSSKIFSFTQYLPEEFTYQRNDSAATFRDDNGFMQQSSINAPRFDHTESGISLGLKIEAEAQNKCENYNASPTSMDGITISNGAATITFPNDINALESVGLHQLGNGQVIKIDNSANSNSCSIDFDGPCGNINPHSFSVWARMGAGTGDLRRTGSGSQVDTISGNSYQRYKLENEIPSFTGSQLRVRLNAGAVMYCLLNQLEENEFVTSEIITTGSSAIRQQDELFLTGLDTYPFFDENQGYMTIRYHPTHEMAGDLKYLMVGNDGTNANTIGLRIDGDNSMRGFMRTASNNNHSAANNDIHLINQTHSAGIIWNQTQATILSGGRSNTQIYVTGPTGINTLQIARSGGTSGIFWGYIQSVSIGKTELKLHELSTKLYRTNDVVVIGGGQSLMRGHFISQETGGETSKQGFRNIVGQSFPDKVVVFADGSTGASAASKTTQSTGYWWDLDSQTRGDALNNFYDVIDNTGIKPTAIFWSQGEQDSHKMGGLTSREQFKQALRNIFNDMHAMLGSIPIFIQKIGRRTSYFNVGGMQEVREVQQEIIDENPLIFFGAESYDQPLFDATHLTDAGYEAVSERLAYRLSSYLNNEESGVGPVVINAIRSGLTINVTLDHDDGTDFTPASNIAAFHFYDDDTEIFISDAVQLSSNEIRLILPSLPIGVETLYYFYDGELTINTAQLVLDNATPTYPLQAMNITL